MRGFTSSVGPWVVILAVIGLTDVMLLSGGSANAPDLPAVPKAMTAANLDNQADDSAIVLAAASAAGAVEETPEVAETPHELDNAAIAGLPFGEGEDDGVALAVFPGAGVGPGSGGQNWLAYAGGFGALSVPFLFSSDSSSSPGDPGSDGPQALTGDGPGDGDDTCEGPDCETPGPGGNPTQPMPEPGSFFLFCTGALVVGTSIRRQRRKDAA